MKYPRTGQRGAPQAFARKLFEILEKENSEIISWNVTGRAFFVKDIPLFSSEVLMKYFRHSKFTSFQRQLNLYGFRKITRGPDVGAYAHRYFQRGHPDLLLLVRRTHSPCQQPEPDIPNARINDLYQNNSAANNFIISSNMKRRLCENTSNVPNGMPFDSVPEPTNHVYWNYQAVPFQNWYKNNAQSSQNFPLFQSKNTHAIVGGNQGDPYFLKNEHKEITHLQPEKSCVSINSTQNIIMEDPVKFLYQKSHVRDILAEIGEPTEDALFSKLMSSFSKDLVAQEQQALVQGNILSGHFDSEHK